MHCRWFRARVGGEQEARQHLASDSRIVISTAMKFDDILEKHIGEFGAYQKTIYFLVSLPAVTEVIKILLPVFILATPKHRCSLPGLTNDTYAVQSEWHERLVNASIPWEQTEDSWEMSSCLMYQYENSTRLSPVRMGTGVENRRITDSDSNSDSQNKRSNGPITNTNLKVLDFHKSQYTLRCGPQRNGSGGHNDEIWETFPQYNHADVCFSKPTAQINPPFVHALCSLEHLAKQWS
ncbi:hypothetical protein RRG08_035972 [Elysia crispata]|uniref:Uncharacterized protein n=1 Tax=Elysia crispata TaxID=231223 RepID=A0AAE1AQJ8_9GAST|nr:hypothetical protein RRG08_035972 [Elysia crispata]